MPISFRFRFSESRQVMVHSCINVQVGLVGNLTMDEYSEANLKLKVGAARKLEMVHGNWTGFVTDFDIQSDAPVMHLKNLNERLQFDSLKIFSTNFKTKTSLTIENWSSNFTTGVCIFW